MQTEHQSGFKIPDRPEVTPEIRNAILDELVSAQHAEVKRAGEQAAKIQLIATEYRDGVRNLLGSANYERLRAYVEGQKQDRAAHLFPPRGPEMSTDDLDRLRREWREASLGYLEGLQISVDQLRESSQQAKSRLQAFDPPRPVRDGRPVMVVLPSDVPDEIRTHKTNPWTLVGPPYGWSWWYDGSNAGFAFIPTLHLNADVGFIGNNNRIDDSDASDNDYGYMKYATAVSFWYQMPTPGLVEVWIEARSEWGHHHVSLFNEFGWSDSMVNQHDYLTLKATVGGSASELQLAEMSWFQENGHTEGYWDNHYLTDGATYWANLISDPNIIIPARSWVLVEVGVLNWNSAFANDVAVYSTLDFAWNIKHVSVHSTGG
jgi:hypothetical protein